MKTDIYDEWCAYETGILRGNVMLEHVTLTNNDLECLKPDQWLYDNVIDFNLQYQRHFMFGYDKDDIEI